MRRTDSGTFQSSLGTCLIKNLINNCDCRSSLNANGLRARNSGARPFLIRHVPTLLALLLAAAPAGALDPRDLLPPEQAFAYTVTAADGALQVAWDIQPGYYLYRDRIGFDSRTAGIALGQPELPEGEIHEDEFFGRMVIYRGPTVIRIPFSLSADAPPRLLLDIRSQGCADAGICYPPQTWEAVVPVTAPRLFARSDEIPAGLSNPVPGEPRTSLPGLAGDVAADAQFLPPEKAFPFAATVAGPNLLLVRWNIADGYYLYRDKLAFEIDGPNIQLGTPELPAGVPQHDEYFGDTEVYYGELAVRLPFARASPAGTEITLLAEFQGCAEDGICYPPMSARETLMLAAVDASAVPGPPIDPPVSEQDRLAGVIGEANPLIMLATFFGLGLLLAFTPCVLPMVPILSAVIAGQGPNLTTRRAFALSVTYVLGMALTYTIAGAAFAAAGQQAQAFFQRPWILAGFSLLFVLLALSMFGFYELQMPAAVQSRLATWSRSQRSGTWIGTAVMGALSALIVTACVMPPLVAALAVIAGTGDVARGALALFALSLGMGAPLIVFGTSAGRLLPKAGPWMESVKAIFGLLMLGLAIWVAGRILPGEITLLLWAALVIIAGVFLGAVEPLPPQAGGGRKLVKGIGLAALAYGAVLLIGAASGGNDPLAPLARLGQSPEVAEDAPVFRRIKTVADLEAELAAARAAGETTMLDFYADWCVSCKEMENHTFTDERVRRTLEGMRLLQADVTANDAADRALLRHFGIYGPPTIAFFGRDGRERVNYRLVGFVPADEFQRHARRALEAPLASADRP
ncbi:hypothetical protein BH24PSE2_BH24PSE2_05550 [soil metagenome]